MVQRKAHYRPTQLRFSEADCWTYRGEGKTGLVVTNNNGLALKLRKGLVEEDYLRLFIRNSQYVEICIAPLFGPFLCYGKITRLPPNFGSLVMSQLHSRRSSLRESDIDYRCPYALLMPDACSLPGHHDVITVEIKPKACLRTTSPHMAPLKCCRFCSNIEKRFSEGSISAKTGYCPREFFSGRTSKVAKSLCDLFDEPLSYLTIHKHGKRVFDEDTRDLEPILGPQSYRNKGELINVIVKILLSHHRSTSGRVKNILQMVEDAQRINALSIPELCNIYTKFSVKGLDLDMEIARWLSGDSSLNEEYHILLDHIIKFSISIIAQDISIMLSITPGHDEQLEQVIANGRVYSYKASIVDVDFKSLKKLPRYLLQEKELCSGGSGTQLQGNVFSETQGNVFSGTQGNVFSETKGNVFSETQGNVS